MAKIPYTKPATAYAEQLQQLKDRGMQIANEPKVLHLLESISYYRLSGYWHPLLADKQTHRFKKGATFEMAFQLYCFDKDLRKLVIAELEKIEVAIRAKMIYVLSHKHGSFWHTNASLFKKAHKHAKSLSKMKEEYDRSDEEFIKAFSLKYSDVYPPAWMAMEITSFGTLSRLYENLNTTKERRDVANYFGLSDTAFESWLHSIVYLRNICAHHTRFWNRIMSISPQTLKSPSKLWIVNTSVQNNKTYYMLSMIKYLLQTVHPNSTFTFRLKELLAKYPNVDIGAMGFPTDWEMENLWTN